MSQTRWSFDWELRASTVLRRMCAWASVRSLSVVALPTVVAASLMWDVAEGFGDRGHRIVAQIALGEMSEEAKASLSGILGERTLPDIASEPDRWRRDQPETAPWHYVNLPPDAAGYDRARDERSDDGALVADKSTGMPTSASSEVFSGNVVERIRHFESVLSDPGATPESAREAVIWLTHLIGDVHQPLHVGLAKDRGGNDIRVHLESGRSSKDGEDHTEAEPVRLHWVWDGTLLDRPGVSWAHHAEELRADITADERRAWRRADLLEWANESWSLANRMAYRDANGRWLTDGDRVGRRYLLTRTVVVEDQLRKAGVRLGQVLDRALAARISKGS